MAARYRRRTSVVFRPWILGAARRFGINEVLDGGEDAPLSRRGRLIFRCVVAAVVVVGLGLLLWTRLT